MSLLNYTTGQITNTVATEVAVATFTANNANVPTNESVVISGCVSAATGTGGTVAVVKVRQGSGIAGTQVGPSISGPVGTANAATSVPFTVVDSTPPSNGVYTITITHTGNSSAVTNAQAFLLQGTGALMS